MEKQAAAEKNMKVAVEAIFSAARVQRIQESGRHGGSKGGLEEGITDSEG